MLRERHRVRRGLGNRACRAFDGRRHRLEVELALEHRVIESRRALGAERLGGDVQRLGPRRGILHRLDRRDEHRLDVEPLAGPRPKRLIQPRHHPRNRDRALRERAEERDRLVETESDVFHHNAERPGLLNQIPQAGAGPLRRREEHIEHLDAVLGWNRELFERPRELERIWRRFFAQDARGVEERHGEALERRPGRRRDRIEIGEDRRDRVG